MPGAKAFPPLDDATLVAATGIIIEAEMLPNSGEIK